jgi:YbbR domain-containing protein
MVFKNLLRWLRTNLTSLTLALLLGLTVWIVANQEQNPVREDNFQSAVPITMTGLKSGLLITNDYPKTTILRLRAQQNTWHALSLADIVVTADLSGLEPGMHQVPLDVTIAARAKMVSVTPSSIQVSIEEEKQREMPIHVNATGQLATGYASETPVIKPSRVTVKGPRSAVDLVGDIETDVSIAGLRETFSDTLSLVAIDADGKEITDVTIEPATVQVTIPITQKADYRDIAITAGHFIGQPEEGYYVTGVTFTPNLITVRGDPDIISSMKPYVETQPINLSGLTSNLIADVTLDLPAGVTPIESGPIRVTITIDALHGSRSLDIVVQTVGLGNKLKATSSPEKVTVILSGPLPILNKLNPTEDIIVTVDLTGLKAGTYQIEPKVDLQRSDIIVESSFPVVISVTIEAQ